LNIISRKFDDIEVIFDNSTSLYINVTRIAKHFNKLPADWLRLKETKSYINALISHYGNLHNGDLVVVRKGGNNKSLTGTWIHKKLIIAFARWLNPEFAVWCDGVIEEILQTGSFSVEKPFSKKEEFEIELLAFNNSVEMLRVNQASKIKMLRTFHKSQNLETSYLPEYSDEEHTFSAKALLEKFEIKISVQQFNKKMISAGFLETKSRKSSKYKTEKDVDGKEVKIPILKEFKSLTEKGLQFGKNMISPKNQLETQPHYFENRFSELLKIIEI
jgi:ribosomal protein L7/L12